MVFFVKMAEGTETKLLTVPQVHPKLKISFKVFDFILNL